MLMSSKRVAVLGVFVLAASGCAANQAPGGPQLGGADWTEVRVENQTANTLRVFAVQGSGETLLGRVGALAQRTIRLPPGISGMVQLMVRPVMGERQHVSEPIQLVEGQSIIWQLQMSPGVSDIPRNSQVRINAKRPAGHGRK